MLFLVVDKERRNNINLKIIHMKKFFILLVAFMATMPVWAYDFLVDGIYYTISSGKVYVTNGSSKYVGDVVIPASVT